MTDTLLSIITPSYNQAAYFTGNIERVQSQGSDDIKHIVVDGGSTDSTVEILEEYENTYNLHSD